LRFGETSLRVTGVLASGLQRRKLRSDLKVSHQVIGGEATYVVKIPETGDFLRLAELEWQVISAFNGERTNREVAEYLTAQDPELELTPAEVEDFLDSTNPALWEKSLAEKNLAVLEKIRGERQERAGESSIFYLYFSAWDPNNFFNRVVPYLRWIWTRSFLLISLGVLFLGSFVFLYDFDRVLTDTLEFYNFYNKTWGEFVDLWILLLLVGFIHECAHGMTCKVYGGDVHQMGFLLMYFTPAFYTDVTDLYLFDRDYKRLWVIFAGIYIELVICAAALIVWSVTAAGSWTHEWSYKLALMTSITGLLMNLNPLMKFDGYYALSQWLKIDNMREDAFDYVKLWLQKYALRRDVELPHVGRRKRRVFLIYGGLAYVYTFLILYLVGRLVFNIFSAKFGEWALPLTLLLVLHIFRKRFQGWIPALWKSLGTAKEKFMVWRMSRAQQAGALAAIVLVTLPPTATVVTTDFTLEPAAQTLVRAQAAGRVGECRVHEGQAVAAGDVLAVLRNAEIENGAAIAERQRELAQRGLLTAQARGDLAEVRRQTLELERLDVAAREARARLERLTLRAPLAGVVTTPRVEQRVGEYIAEGDTFAVVADGSRMRARVLVRDWELEDVQPAARARLQVLAMPVEMFEGQVESILPAAALDRPVANPTPEIRKGQELTNFFAVTLQIPNADGRLMEGMTGTARIYGNRYPLAVRAGRALWRWLRSQVY
jgi:putative peptide zinc metalloprotease protein